MFIRSLPRLYQAGESSEPSLSQTTGFLRASGVEDGDGTRDNPLYENTFDRSGNEPESKNASAGTRFVTRIRRC